MTKFVIDAEALKLATKRASLAVENRNSIPILGNLLLTAKGDTVSFYGTNMDLSIEHAATAQVETEDATTVNAKALASLAAGFAKGSRVEFALENDRVIVRNGRSSNSLPTLPAADMPRMVEKAREAVFTLSAVVLLAEIDKVKHAISTEETRYYLNGIYWHRPAKSDVLRMVTTDGHRLALADIPAPEGTVDMPGVIVPRDTVLTLRKLLAGKAVPAVKCEVGREQLRFTVGGTVLMSKIIDGTFPAYQRVIPTQNGITIAFDRAGMLAVLGRLVKFGSRGTKAIRFDAKGDDVQLTVRDGEAGACSDNVRGRVSAPIEVGFNGKYVVDTLNAMQGDTVEMRLSDSASPVVLCSPDYPSQTHVIMPLRRRF